MSYAHDMGHDIPNDEDYCPVTDAYYDPDTNTPYFHSRGLNSLSVRKVHYISNSVNIIHRNHRVEEDEFGVWEDTTETLEKDNDDSPVLTSGIHSGKSLKYLLANERQYCDFCLEKSKYFRKLVIDYLSSKI